MIVIPQLLDRLMKLDQQLKPYQTDEVEYVYRVAGSEGEEPDGDEAPDEELEFLLLSGEHPQGPFSASDLKHSLEMQRRMGEDPLILVQFWHRAEDNRMALQWSG